MSLDLEAVKADLEYASGGIDGPDMPYHPHALAAMRAAEKLVAEVERLRNRPPTTAPRGLGTSIRTDCPHCGAEVWT